MRYSTAVGGFAAAIYDPSAYYRPLAQLMDDGKVGRSAYDDRSGIMASYVERLDSTDHSVASRMLSNFTVAGYSRYNGFGQLNNYTDTGVANEFDIYSSSQPNAGATVTFAPEASLFCQQVPALSSDTVCPATSSDDSNYTISVIGSAFALSALVTPKTSTSGNEGVSNQTPITLSWAPPSGGGAKLTFEYASGSAVNGAFNLYSAANPEEPMATSQTMAVPRQWLIVAYEDNAFVFGDGKLVLSASAKSSDPWTVENYLFTTATTTITLDTDGASFTNLGAGSAPVLGMSYMNAAGQPIQRHILNLMRSASAEQQQGSLVDVTDAKLFDGWGGPAVQTLSMYYTANTEQNDVEMLAYRSTFLPVFDWVNGKIEDDVASDLYAFYATGAGADRVQFAQDPYYALAFANRYQEPAGRDNQGAGVGYPLSLAASQSRVTTTDYQNWNDASLSSAVNVSTDLQSDFNTSSSYGGFGANLTTYRQSVKDVNDLSGVNRQAWIASSAASKKKAADRGGAGGSGEVLSGGMFSLNVPVPSTLTPSPGVNGTLARYMQSLLPNYFAGSAVSSPGNFVKSDAYVDLLGQWSFVESDVYISDGQSWNGKVSYGYSYDPNGNLTGIETGVPSAGAQGALLQPRPGTSLATREVPLQIFEAAAEDALSSFTRSGSDQLTGAALASGTSFGLAYDSGNTYGDVSQISSGNDGFGLSLTRDAHTRQVTAQTITNNSSGKTVLTATMSYDPMGRRTSRTITVVDEGSGSSTTTYWYGKALVPLVVERDGATYRMLGGLVIEERVNGKAGTQYYPHRDYASSVRVVTDGAGAVAASLGYDGDWGSARIQGQDYVASDAGMEAFYRFQSQEAEIFPLSALSIEDQALESWLDELQLHHFPYREYSAGLAIFLSHDPAGQSISPYAAFGANPANITDPTGAAGEFIRSAPFREFVFTFAWGAWVVLLTVIARNYYEGEHSGLLDLGILGGGRLLGNMTMNVLMHRRVLIGDRKVLVRGPIELNNVSSREAGLEALIQTALMEIGEAAIAYPAGVGLTALGANEFTKTFVTFCAIAVLDGVWTKVYQIRWPAKKTAYYLVDDTGAEANIMMAIMRRGATDAVYYTGMLFTWTYALDPDPSAAGAILGGSMWFARNFGHRLIRQATWGKLVELKQSLMPDKRTPLVKYKGDEDYHQVYVQLNEHGEFMYAFVWEWKKGERPVKLQRMLEAYDRALRNPKTSWEEQIEQQPFISLPYQRNSVTYHSQSDNPLSSVHEEHKEQNDNSTVPDDSNKAE